jgi:hypothetical protein
VGRRVDEGWFVQTAGKDLFRFLHGAPDDVASGADVLDEADAL